MKLEDMPDALRNKVKAELDRTAQEKSSKKKKKIRVPRAPKPRVVVRTRQVPEFGKHFPELAQIVLGWYWAKCQASNRCSLSFAVNELPKSLNHQYIHTRYGTRLDESVKPFRKLVSEAIGAQKFTWKPTGVTAAVIFFENPLWITKERVVREMDCDNRVKPVFDAAQQATDVPDELHWQFHVFKIPSKRTRTTVYLFDMGDVVDFFA